jgi:hypothetical protein
MVKTVWKGEGRKVRTKTLNAINARMKGKVGESDLGRAHSQSSSCLKGWIYRESGESVSSHQARLYAAALGVPLADAQARIARQESILAEAGQPTGFHLKEAREFVSRLFDTSI